MKYIQYGAGSIGLGLIGQVVAENKHHIIFINRSRENSKKNELLEAKKPILLQSLKDGSNIYQLTDYEFFASEDENTLKAIADPEVRILSTAVRQENLHEAAERIVKGLSLRSQRLDVPLLCIMACENIPSNSDVLKEHITSYCDERTRQFIDEHVTFLNTVIDRICLSSSAERGLVVKVEDEYEWIINVGRLEDPDLRQEFLGFFSSTPLVKLVGELAFQFYERKKLWLMNGIHMVLGIVSLVENQKHPAARGIQTVGDALSREDVIKRLRLAQKAFAIGLAQFVKDKGIKIKGATQNDLDKYNEKIFLRLQDSKLDKIDRFLADIIKPDVEQVFEQAYESIKKYGLPEGNKEKVIERLYSAFDINVYLKKLAERISEPFKYFLMAIKGQESLPKDTTNLLINLAELSCDIFSLQHEYYSDVVTNISKIIRQS